MPESLSTNSISDQHYRDVGDRGIFVAVLWYFLPLSHFLFYIKNVTFYMRYRIRNRKLNHAVYGFSRIAAPADKCGFTLTYICDIFNYFGKQPDRHALN